MPGVGVKRKRTGIIKRRSYIKRPTKKRRFAGKAGIQRVVANMLTKKLETKQSLFTSSDYVQIEHNTFITLDTNLLATNPGTADKMDGVGERIGDEITLKGARLKFMFELNERYSDCTARILIVKAARGDVPTIETLWTKISGNKMLDNLNTERYTIVFQKYVKLKAPNLGLGASAVQQGTAVNGFASGIYAATPATAENRLSRATKIVSVWLPGTKFARSGVIKYENNGSVQKFYDYHVLVYAYANYNTISGAGSGYNIMAVNDYIRQLYYTDA